MSREENVIKYYVFCNKLKDMIRTGWKEWNVKRERVESVAEHIFGTQMLAVAMWSEYRYDIDIQKVLTMLALHEMEEIIIGDLTQFDVDKQTKLINGHKAVEKLVSILIKGADLKSIIYEFDEKKTPEAKFAFYCDKLECDLQSKLYDEQHCVDLAKQKNKELNDDEVKNLLKTDLTWGQMWMTFSKAKYNYDENFSQVSDYAFKNNISEINN